MDRIRRNERLAAMTRILVESPNKIFTLGTFCEMFGAAKSTLSEDIDILRGVFAQFHLGQLDTVTGAAGGVRYRPVLAPEDAYRTVKDLAQMLAAPGRVLPGESPIGECPQSAVRKSGRCANQSRRSASALRYISSASPAIRETE